MIGMKSNNKDSKLSSANNYIYSYFSIHLKI